MDQSLRLRCLSLIVFLPAAGALVLAFFPRTSPSAMKAFSLVVTAVVFLLTVVDGAAAATEPRHVRSDAASEDAEGVLRPWIPSFNIHYFMGIDGISFPLVC